ncbi:MAG: TRAP transporter substrate-binding protein [Rhodomicrobium sp.]
MYVTANRFKTKAAIFTVVARIAFGRHALRKVIAMAGPNIFLIAIGALVMAFIIAGQPQASRAQNIELRLEHSLPESSPQQTRFFLPWARRIEAASHGRIHIKITASMGLGGKPFELLGKVERSEVDIVWTLAGFTPGRFPKLSVFELPWLASSRAGVTSMAIQEYYESYARDELADVHVLAVWCHSSGVIMNRDQEVRLPSDIKGLRIRTPSAQVSAMLSAFGAEPKHMPAAGVATEFDQGHLDGTVFPYEVVPTFKLQNRIHHISEFAGDRGLYTAVFIFAMSRSAYSNMPPELRQIIDENSGMKLAAELGRLWDEFETAGREAYEASGGTVTFIKGEQYDAWYRQSQPLADAWIREQKEHGNDGLMLLKAAKDLIAKYSSLWAPYRE